MMNAYFDVEDMLEGVSMHHAPSSLQAASQRAWTRRRPHQEPRSFYISTPPGLDTPQTMRDYRFYGCGSHAISSRIEELSELDDAATPQLSKNTQPRQEPYMRHGLQPQCVPFSQAARAMHAALVCADQECRSIEASFALQMREVLAWLPLSYANTLWTIRLSWNGRLQQHSVAPSTDAQTESTKLVTYGGISQRFNAAFLAIKTCSPPNRTSISSNQGESITLVWEVLGSTMRKLQISLEAIEELLVLVKTQHERMPLLLHEIASAQYLLESVREVWESKDKAGKRLVTTTSPSLVPAAASPTQTRSTEYAWPRYSTVSECYDESGIEI